MDFFLKNGVKIEQKILKRKKIANTHENGWKDRKILKITASGATFWCSIRNDYWF